MSCVYDWRPTPVRYTRESLCFPSSPSPHCLQDDRFTLSSPQFVSRRSLTEALPSENDDGWASARPEEAWLRLSVARDNVVVWGELMWLAAGNEWRPQGCFADSFFSLTRTHTLNYLLNFYYQVLTKYCTSRTIVGAELLQSFLCQLTNIQKTY